MQRSQFENTLPSQFQNVTEIKRVEMLLYNIYNKEMYQAADYCNNC